MAGTDRRLTLLEALAEVTRERNELRDARGTDVITLTRAEWVGIGAVLLKALYEWPDARVAAAAALVELEKELAEHGRF